MADISPVTDIPTDAAGWLEQIKLAIKDAAPWSRRSKRIQKLYSEERGDADRAKARYAMLWANTEVLKPAVYAREPKPAITRRFTDRDPTGKAVADLLQRSCISIFDRSNLDTCLRSVRDDFVLVGRGTMWVRYEPTIVQNEGDPANGIEPYEEIQDETVCYDFVAWADFIVPKALRWEEVPWIARRVHFDKAQLVKRFGEEFGEKIFNSSSEKTEGTSLAEPMQKNTKFACIYEVWSKRDNKVYWVAQGLNEYLDEQPPLYNLHGFYPCPKPAFATLPTDTIYPVADYVYYQDQAQEINDLTQRIGALTDALKLVGFYPSGMQGEGSSALEKAFSPQTDNEMIPVPSWAAFKEGGGAGAGGLIEWWPADKVSMVLKSCIETRRILIEDVYQITGISDILRGSTQASETATAQQIKAQWGGIRIRDKQAEMARVARDVTRITAEIVSEKFQPETIWRMTGLKYPTEAEKAEAVQKQQMAAAQPPQPGAPEPEATQAEKDALEKPTQEEIIALMRDDQLRSYRVDVETDSTIEPDEQAAKASINEFINVVGGFLNQSLPVAQQIPAMVPVLGEILSLAARTYRGGAPLEDVLDGAIQQIVERAKAAEKAPPQPDPKILLEQEKLKVESKKNDDDTVLRQEQLTLDKAKLAQERFSEEAMLLTGGLADPSMLMSTIAQLTQSGQAMAQELARLREQQGAPSELIRDQPGNTIGVRKCDKTYSVVRAPDGTIAGLQ